MSSLNTTNTTNTTNTINIYRGIFSYEKREIPTDDPTITIYRKCVFLRNFPKIHNDENYFKKDMIFDSLILENRIRIQGYQPYPDATEDAEVDFFEDEYILD